MPVVPDSRRNVEAPSGSSTDQPNRLRGFEIVDSDRLLWVPPYQADSPPPSLELLPPGPAGIVSVSIADLITDDQTQPMRSAFSAEINSLIQLVEQRSGVDRNNLARCTVALFPGRSGWPEIAMAIELAEPVELSTLTDKWNAQESRAGDAVIYAGDDVDSDAFFIGDGEQGKLPEGRSVSRFAVGKLQRIREVADNNGGTIPLVRSMQTLWNQTSRENDLVAMVTPNFLFADGREMVLATVPQFQAAMKRWLIPDVAAVSLSFNIDDNGFYAELREVPSGGATSATILKSLRQSIQSWPQWADQFILDSVPDASWRLLATRLPLMLRFVADQTRSTIDDDTVVASCYLPVDAASQVSLATFLAMNTASDGQSGSQSPVAKTMTIAQMLDHPMSISFLQLSLQFSMDAVAEEFQLSLPEGIKAPKIRIIGGDLEKDGITQNQQIRGFECDALPLRDVLTQLVRKANPDATATSSHDPNQKLIWVIHPLNQSAAETEILITTRAAASGQYELPQEFELQQ